MKKVVVLLTLSIILSAPAQAVSEKLNSNIAFEYHGAAMLVINVSTGEIIDANLAAERFYGYSIEEFKKMKIDQINILPVDAIRAEMDAALTEERNYFLFKHKLKDGSVRDVEVYSSPTSEQENQILLSIIHDITPKILAEKEARRNQIIIIVLLSILSIALTSIIIHINQSRKKEKKLKFRYQNLFDNMQEGFAVQEIICNAEGLPIDYRFLEVNRAVENLTGLKAEDIKNKTVKERFPDIEQDWIEKYGEVALKNTAFCIKKYSRVLGKHVNISVYSPQKNQFAMIITDITEQVEAREKIEQERKLLEVILEDALSGYWDWDLEHNEEYLSPSFKAMFGYKDHELRNAPETWQKLIYRDDLSSVMECFHQHIDSNGKIPFYNEVRYRHKNGSIVWVLCSGRVVEWKGDKPLRMVGCHIDITRIKELEKRLREERNLFKTTLHSLGDGVISTDKEGNVHLMNAVAENITEWSNDEAKGVPFEKVFHIIHEMTRETCQNPVNKVFKTGEIIELAQHTLLVTKTGKEIPIEDRAAPIKDENGDINGVVIVFRDYTEKKENQEVIHYLSHHDQLTGLYNRHVFEARLHELDIKHNLPYTIAMADVNGLKLTNDAFGHQVGDKLLKSVADLLKRECRLGDTLSRIGGDEFVLLMPKTTRSEAEKIIKRIYQAVETYKIDNIVVSVSIGWETKEDMDQCIHEVLKKAEEHMYRNKLIESQSMRNQTIKVIMQTLYETNRTERIHSERVGQISRRIGEGMKLDGETLEELEVAGIMHDIGKVAINENILNKTEKLSRSESEEIKRHPEIGYHILKSVDAYTNLADYVLSHHERWDGKGYPRGLSGKNIPLIARIISVADTFEAMIGERLYKKSLTPDQAIMELKKNSGTKFDPYIVEVFVQLFDESLIVI